MEQMKLIFTLPEFEGPLDLLLFLVRKHRVDIRSIPITVIADEFIAHIEKMKSLDMVVTSDFLLMASTLLQMKSKALLPRLSPKEAQELENNRKNCTGRLKNIKRLKNYQSGSR